jgi:energy-coupling factor transport system permease protein
MVLESDRKLGLLGLDPRTHLAAMVAAGAATMVVADLRLILLTQAIAAVYLMLNGRVRLAALCCVWFVAFFALGLLPMAGVWGEFILDVLHMMPVFTCGCALFTQSPSAIMCALERWHAPRVVVVGACMLFRFGALLVFEVKSIVRGIRMRSIFPRGVDAIAHPALAYECVYVPLVMRSLRLSSELAASAQLRGVEIEGGRTSIHHVGFAFRDAAAAFAMAALYAAIIIGDVIL